MANINVYPNSGEPYEDSDKVIGTEASDTTVAKNFTLLGVWNYVASKVSNGVNQILFNSNSSPTDAAGVMSFDGVNFNLRDNIAGTSIQIGKEIVVDVYNNNGVTLTNFTAVRYGTSVSGYPAAIRAQADTVTNANSFGVCTHDIAVGEVGKVTTQGVAVGDTSMWNENDILFLSATTPGALTNVEQPILKPMGRVLVADTEANGGKIYIFQQGIFNATAIGQIIGSGTTQSISSTPTPVNGYTSTPLELNTTVTTTGTTNKTASISPATTGASGYYRVCFNVSGSSGTNELFIFEAYYDGAPTGIVCEVDLNNSQVDYGNDSINQITNQILTDVDNIEIYCYSDGATGNFVYSKVSFNLERLGNV